MRSQRDEALGALRQRFGGDAVERAAFAFFSSSAHKAGAGRGGADRGGRRTSGEEPGDGDGSDDPAGMTSGRFGDFDDGECPKIPVSVVVKALRPVYGPDCDYAYENGSDGGDGPAAAVLLTPEAVAEAVTAECGTGCSTTTSEGGRQGGSRLTFEEFLAVADRLTRRNVDHASRCD